ncbi:uncharacterized protein [Malus domestica]|uniref:uncharacterized protein n=1 Tax=Malus domestica TaxID=3750 RepID=UPI0039764B49
MSDMKKKIEQILEFHGQFREQGKLPSSTVVNPNGGFETANAITLRSGKEVGTSPKNLAKRRMKSCSNKMKHWTNPRQGLYNPCCRFLSPLCCPKQARFMQARSEEDEKGILETFRKVHVNIPLLDAIKQIPKYAKFLKKLCTTRKRIREKDVVHVSENVSAMLQRKLPPKCKDPGELKNDGVIIQLADQSNVYPKGVLEDVLVQVDHLIFSIDFYVLDMEDSGHSPPLQILLGRPFMKTSHTKIDVAKGALTMEFGGDMINFKVSESVTNPNDVRSFFAIDVIKNLGQERSAALIKKDVPRTTNE